MGVCNCSMFCCMLLYVHSSIAIILMGKRELIALLNLSSWCLVMVERLFLAVPRGCLQFVIVVFPDHTRLLTLIQPDFWTVYNLSALTSANNHFMIFFVSYFVPVNVLVRAYTALYIVWCSRLLERLCWVFLIFSAYFGPQSLSKLFCSSKSYCENVRMCSLEWAV